MADRSPTNATDRRPTLEDQRKHTESERFWNKVDMQTHEGCWRWTASLGVGYGRFHLGARPVLAHRYAYEHLREPIPAGMVIDHLCRNPACVNPDHLEVVTPRENVLRGNNQSAEQARRTHCKNGHVLGEGNLVLSQLARGHRLCRTCNNANRRVGAK